ncbi:hypothetical protein ACSMXN_14360 [Jatrophihabitans sp. DSM 45814]
MGRANVYLPDELEKRVKDAQIPISEVCQRALLAAVEAAEAGPGPFDDVIEPQFQRGWKAGASWTQTAPNELLLTLLRDQRLGEIPAETLPQDLYALTREQALAWEAGFMSAARATVRMPAASTASPEFDAANPTDATPNSVAGDPPGANTAQEGSRSNASAELGDDSDCQIGVTLDGDPVSFDPHTAVRDGKSPLFAILGEADLRTRLVLSVAQDAASRGTGVLLVDLSGQLISRAAGLGRNVRVIRRAEGSLPRLDQLMEGSVGLGGLWETFSSLSRGSGLGGLLGGSSEKLIEPGYVTVLGLAGDGQLAAALSAAQTLAQLASPADFPRMLHVDLPAEMALPAGLASGLGRIVRTAQEHNAAIGLSAESADVLTRIGGIGALLSTAFAFATSNPIEADRLRDLLGTGAPILLNPPGTAIRADDETWAVMRDLAGRLGQVRMIGW